jgi:hypothetical protein
MKRFSPAIFPVFITTLLAFLLTTPGCGGSYTPTPNNITNSRFPSVRGNSLNGESVEIPERYYGRNTLLLVGYQQRAQFDIDRWILGALQAAIPVEIVEVPTIAGMVPQMVQGFIDNGMRSGIPKSDWASVVTVYEDSDKVIAALGNDRPQSGYAVLLDKQGRIVWSSNLGYSATQVIALKGIVAELGE